MGGQSLTFSSGRSFRYPGLFPKVFQQIPGMKYLYLLVILLPFGSSAQKRQEDVSARILDASQIFANYRWALDLPSSTVLREALGDSLSRVVIKKTQEGQWPSGFRSVQDREENRAYFCDLKADLVCPLATGRVLLRVPAVRNRHLPGHLQAKEDWYIVIRENALDLLGEESPFPETLGSQVAFLLEDFLNGYAQSRAEDSNSSLFTLDGQVIESRFLLSGARSSIFLRTFSTGRMSFQATFPPVLYREDGIRQYRDVLQQVTSTLFRACPMAAQKEVSLSNGGLQTTLLAFDYTGDMDPRCKGLHIELQLLPSFSQSVQVPVWIVRLGIIP